MGWTPAYFPTLVGWLFMRWLPTSSVLSILYYFHFRVFLFLSLHRKEMWAVWICWKLEKSILMKIPLLLLIPRSIYLSAQYVWHFLIRFVVKLMTFFFARSIHFISFHLIHIPDSIFDTLGQWRKHSRNAMPLRRQRTTKREREKNMGWKNMVIVYRSK